MKKVLISFLAICLLSVFSFAQDTVSLVHYENGEKSLIIINTGDDFNIRTWNQKGIQIFEQTYDLNTKLVDYTLTYFDSGAVESIKMTISNYENEYKEIQYVEFDYLGGEVKSKHVSGIDVEIQDEGESFNFEGGVVFRARPEE